MVARGVAADEQSLGDLPVGPPIDEVTEHLVLAGRELTGGPRRRRLLCSPTLRGLRVTTFGRSGSRRGSVAGSGLWARRWLHPRTITRVGALRPAPVLGPIDALTTVRPIGLRLLLPRGLARVVGPIRASDPFRLTRALRAIYLIWRTQPIAPPGTFRSIRPIRPNHLASIKPIRLDRTTWLLLIVRVTESRSRNDYTEITAT